MHLFLPILAYVALSFGLSFLGVYTYGRFARDSRGERSKALPTTPAGTALDRIFAPLAQTRPGQTGLRLLADNLEAFAARAHAARSAGRSLDLQYYIWENDLTGGLLGREVVAAADRGVRVRLLIDDINAQGRDPLYLTLDAHPHIELRLFNPSRSRRPGLHRGFEILLRAFSATRRMHNKAWIADGRAAIVGGRNIGDQYFDAAQSANFRDLDLLVAGSAVGQIEAVFDGFWNSASVLPIRAFGKRRKADLPALRQRLDRLATSGRAAPYLARVAAETDARSLLADTAGFHWAEDVRVLSDPPNKARGARSRKDWLAHAIYPLIGSAERELLLVSPYFIPGEKGVENLRRLAGRGVRVAALTNSLAATDVMAVHGAYAHYRKALLEAGIELYELRPEPKRTRPSLFGSRGGASLHTKAFTVDGRTGFVGSFNFDPRSISLNTEMGVFFTHDALVEEVRQVIAEEIGPEDSFRVILEDGRLVWADGAGAQAEFWKAEPEASLWRRLAATAIGWLPIESQL
ncbi:MAG TPA: phospholipase D family protein [Mesorhizobium sp.]|jgi:putative cardiolipin synthase|nr:phospholipase D family protein [Mesorhizobium sp.]